MTPNSPNDLRKTRHAQNMALVGTLERIRAELGLSKPQWAEFLRLQEKEYEQVKTGRKPLSAVSLYHVSERLSLDPMALETGKIDFVALVQAYHGNRSYLSPDYRVAASSRKFTVINTLNYVEKFRGPHLRIAANRHFQIHEDFWSDWQNPESDRINIRFLGELWKYLRTRGISDAEFQAIGFHSVVTHRKTHIGHALSSLSKPSQVYEALFGSVIHCIEENHVYRIIRLTDELCVVESSSNPDVAEALKARHTGSLEGCQFKIGLMRSLPTFIDCPPASVHETLCLHKGDRVCRFFCDFSAVRIKNGFPRRLSIVR